MANRRKSMIIIEEIKRLKGLGLSQRKIAKTLGIHRSTVKKYWLAPPEELPDEDPAWAVHLDWNYLSKEIDRKTSRKILYEEQSEVIPLPSYSSFCRILLKKAKKDHTPKISIKIPRSPGESVETDYSGDSIDILNPATGEILKTELFVGTMSCSSHIFGDFTFSQKLEDWIESHNKMFKFYGGVPRYEITDNLKSAVNKPDRYDPEINRSFNDMARHYGLAIDPADVREPQHKPNVEKSVHVLQQDFFPRIRNRTFTSLGELNKCLREYLKVKNAEVMKERGNSRDYFFDKERPFLKDLPPTPYEIHHWKKAKIHPDCHFQFQRNFYSLPHKFVGRQVDLKYSNKMVHAYSDSELIYSHQLGKGHGQYFTNENHYPEEKLVVLQMNIQSIYKRAEKVGENTLMLVNRLFKMPRFPLKNLRKVQAVMGMTKKYSTEAIEYACGVSLERNKYGYYFLNSCAKNYRKQIDVRVDKAPMRQLELICLQGGKSNE
jgi:transposase